MLVVVQREERRAITSYRWGLVPHWSADLKTGSRMFNARAETLTTSPAFREAFKRRRCLVPAESFYEWKREGSVRQPYRVVREDGRPLALAGLWAGWKDPIDRAGPAHLHDRDHDAERGDRRPPRPDARADPGRRVGTVAHPTVAAPDELLAMLQPTDEIALRIYAVNRDVNDVRRDGPELIEPLAVAAAAPEGTLGI